MNNKEMIERALYPLIINAKARRSWWRRGIARGLARFLGGVLAKQAIVIPVGIRHTPSLTFIEYGEGTFYEALTVRGHHGILGKALAIVLPSPKKANG